RTEIRISGGSIETDRNEFTVMPTGWPVRLKLTTVTQVAKRPITRRNSCGSIEWAWSAASVMRFFGATAVGQECPPDLRRGEGGSCVGTDQVHSRLRHASLPASMQALGNLGVAQA